MLIVARQADRQEDIADKVEPNLTRGRHSQGRRTEKAMKLEGGEIASTCFRVSWKGKTLTNHKVRSSPIPLDKFIAQRNLSAICDLLV